MPVSSSDRALNTRLVAVLCHDPTPVGIVAVALMMGTYGLFGLPVDLPLLVAGFSGTALTYLADRAWTDAPEDRVNRPGRVDWVQTCIRWLAVETVVLFALGGTMVLYLEWATLALAGALGAVAGVHVLLRGQKGGLFLGGPKPIVIAGAWAVGGTLVPLVEAGCMIDPGALLFCGYRGLFVLPNLLLADWADRAGDAAAGLMPWAAGRTARQVRWMATASLLVAMVGAVAWVLTSSTPVLVGLDAIGLLLMLGVVWGLNPKRPRTAVLADLVVGWPLVPALGTWMIV